MSLRDNESKEKSPSERTTVLVIQEGSRVHRSLAGPGDMLVIKDNTLKMSSETMCIVLAFTGDWPLILVSRGSRSYVLFLKDLYVRFPPDEV